MVNYFYTLLLNSKPADSKFTYYRDSSYRPIELKGVLKDINIRLFPKNTFEAKAYYASCYVDMLDSFDLRKYTYSIDKRITYTPGDPDFKRIFDNKVTINSYGVKGVKYYLNELNLLKSELEGTYSWEIARGNTHTGTVEGFNLSDIVTFVNGMPTRVYLIRDILAVDVPSAYNIKVNVKLLSIKDFSIKEVAEAIDSYVATHTPKVTKALFNNDKYTSEVNDLVKIYKTSSDMFTRLSAFILIYLFKLAEMYEQT